VVNVRYFAGARAAAGIAEEKAEAATLNELLSQLRAAHGERLATVLTGASYLIDGLAWHDRDAVLPDGATVDVLPPFAGG
jgi:molybdopterin synthase sulfur carrier subunit